MMEALILIDVVAHPSLAWALFFACGLSALLWWVRRRSFVSALKDFSDLVVAYEFSERRLRVLNPLGRHALRGRSTAFLGDILAADTVEHFARRLEESDEDEDCKTPPPLLECAARHVGAYYEVSAGPKTRRRRLLTYPSRSSVERILVFRDVAARAADDAAARAAAAELECKLRETEAAQRYHDHEIKNGILAALALLEVAMVAAAETTPATPPPPPRCASTNASVSSGNNGADDVDAERPSEGKSSPHWFDNNCGGGGSRSSSVDESGTPLARLATLETVLRETLFTLENRQTLLLLGLEKYVARPEVMNLRATMCSHVERLTHSERAFVLAPNAPAQQKRLAALKLDRFLVKTVMDNVSSNALKYGDDAVPPVLRVHLGEENNALATTSSTSCVTTGCRLVMEVENACLPAKAEELSRLGEADLNRLAATLGRRVSSFPDAHANTSRGDGFCIAKAAARAMGGELSLRLGAGARTVVACLELPWVECAHARESTDDELRLSSAIVDDSRIVVKTLSRKLANSFPRAARVPLCAGNTRLSIESFVDDVVRERCQVVLVDQHLGVHAHDLVGTDLVADLRRRDECDPPNFRRVIFIISAADAPVDLATYLAAGADAHLSKTASVRDIAAAVQSCLKRPVPPLPPPHTAQNGRLARARAARQLTGY